MSIKRILHRCPIEVLFEGSEGPIKEVHYFNLSRGQGQNPGSHSGCGLGLGPPPPIKLVVTEDIYPWESGSINANDSSPSRGYSDEDMDSEGTSLPDRQ